MPYYTRSGDQGRTCALGFGRLGKESLRIEALGDFDELSSALGLAASFCSHKPTRNTLQHLQNDIHTVCAEISGGNNMPMIREQHLTEIELAISRIESSIGEQHSFLIAGGSKEASLIHHARAVCRRAERSLVRLSKDSTVRQELLTYANRLSSLLYVLARLQNKVNRIEELVPKYRYQE